MKIVRFEDLEIWKEARELCRLVYKLTSNSRGSTGEVRSQSYRAFDFKYINEGELNALLEKTDNLSRKTFNLMQHLKKSDIKGLKYS